MTSGFPDRVLPVSISQRFSRRNDSDARSRIRTKMVSVFVPFRPSIRFVAISFLHPLLKNNAITIGSSDASRQGQ